MERTKETKEGKETGKEKSSSGSDILKAHTQEKVAGASGDSALLYQAAYKLDVERAERGVKKYRELYDVIEDEDIKDRLSSETDGEELRALYLGIKPYGNFVNAYGKYRLPLETVKEHIVGELVVADNGCIFSSDLVKQVLENHKELFSDYDPSSSVEAYIAQRSSPYISDVASKELLEQNGLLFGFPPPEAKKYAQFAESKEKIRADMQFYINSESREAQNVFYHFVGSGFLDAKFKANNRKILSDIIDKHAQDVGGIEEGAKDYILSLQIVKLPGFIYMTDHPESAENKEFARRVRDAFERFGL
jgi:hypothetical protein